MCNKIFWWHIKFFPLTIITKKQPKKYEEMKKIGRTKNKIPSRKNQGKEKFPDHRFLWIIINHQFESQKKMAFSKKWEKRIFLCKYETNLLIKWIFFLTAFAVPSRRLPKKFLLSIWLWYGSFISYYFILFLFAIIFSRKKAK